MSAKTSSDAESHVFSEHSEVLTLPARDSCNLQFNVMPNRDVRETLSVTQYRVHRDGSVIEADFAREYSSQMEKSPDHLIFLSALIQTQKLAYILVCYRLGLDIDVDSGESVKIWPTRFDMNMPRLVRNKKPTQRVEITEMRELSTSAFQISIRSDVDSIMTGTADLYVKVLAN